MSLTCDKCNNECECISGPTVDNKWVCDSCNITPEQTVKESVSSDESEEEDDFHCERCGHDSEDNTCHPFGCILLCDGCHSEERDGEPQCPRGYNDGECEICEELWKQIDYESEEELPGGL